MAFFGGQQNVSLNKHYMKNLIMTAMDKKKMPVQQRMCLKTFASLDFSGSGSEITRSLRVPAIDTLMNVNMIFEWSDTISWGAGPSVTLRDSV